MSRTEDESLKERVARLERRQEVILERQDLIIRNLEEHQEALFEVREALKMIRPKPNDNDNN